MHALVVIIPLLGVAALILAAVWFTEREARRRRLFGSLSLAVFVLAMGLGIALIGWRSGVCRVLGGEWQGNPPTGRCIDEWGGTPFAD